MQLISNQQSFSGQQQVYRHFSKALNCEMNFAIYVPQHSKGQTLPVIYWLSGLTCTEQNFITKAGAQQYASQHQVIVVAPDTSPRGEKIADDSAYDLGQGAGFYLNATQRPWSMHYRMYDYIVYELRHLVDQYFPSNGQQSIMGHSMGGLGALVIGLRNPNLYLSISAFSPIVAPLQSAWGQKAFQHYLGSDQATWAQYDPIALLKTSAQHPPILIDQGLKDEFYPNQLHTDELASFKHHRQLKVNLRPDYDHSYYFIQSFIGQHITFHMQSLKRQVVAI
jgi:S-formylglutathione hydrolase